MQNLLYNDFIYINFLNKWSLLDPENYKIKDLKHTFENIPHNSFDNSSFACYLIEDKKIKETGVVLIPIKKIKTNTFANMFSPKEYLKESLIESPTEIINFIILNFICPDSGICMVFGIYIDELKKYFNGFKTLEYLDRQQAIRISYGSMGFVHRINYQKNGYTANLILKSSNKKESDNLFYEYLVGQYINKQCKIFPCFIETYGLYKYDSHESWEYMKKYMFPNEEHINLKLSLELQSEKVSRSSFTFASKNSQYLAILIQNVKNSITFGKMIDPNSLQRNNFLQYDIINVLYQIYMPLFTIANTFTHYDLHLNNILLCEPVEGKYIDYKYILKCGTIVEFKSRYIVKIIDYSRSFFIDTEDDDTFGSSKQIYKTVENLGILKESTGFTHLEPDDGSFYYISSSSRNISFDLQTLYELRLRLTDLLKILNSELSEKYKKRLLLDNNLQTLNPELLEILTKIEYGRGEGKWIRNPDPFEEELYGTKEILTSGFPEKILNIIDAHEALKNIVLSKKDENNEHYKSMESLGTFLIYQSGKTMEFIPKNE